jgi:hypothetical protein
MFIWDLSCTFVFPYISRFFLLVPLASRNMVNLSSFPCTIQKYLFFSETTFEFSQILVGSSHVCICPSGFEWNYPRYFNIVTSLQFNDVDPLKHLSYHSFDLRNNFQFLSSQFLIPPKFHPLSSHFTFFRGYSLHCSCLLSPARSIEFVHEDIGMLQTPVFSCVRGDLVWVGSRWSF